MQVATIIYIIILNLGVLLLGFFVFFFFKIRA